MNELFQRLNGRCPHCDGIVNIIEGMVYDYTLDRDGFPAILNTEHYKVLAYCQSCKRCLFVAPNSNGGYTVYPENNAIPMMIHSIYPDKHLRSSALGIKLLECEDNPFINVTYEDDTDDDYFDDDCPF